MISCHCYRIYLPCLLLSAREQLREAAVFQQKKSTHTVVTTNTIQIAIPVSILHSEAEKSNEADCLSPNVAQIKLNPHYSLTRVSCHQKTDAGFWILDAR